MQHIKYIFQLLRAVWVIPGIDWNNERFRLDLQRWKELCLKKDISNPKALAMLLWNQPEFRNLVIYRHRHRPFFRVWLTFWYRPMDTLYLDTPDIGGGFFIHHGFSTMIAAKSIGENCWINQQVTIGYNGHGDPPVIGDNVMITCGAKVLGDITLGDHVTVGANAVVVRDVEPNVVVGGVPARILKHKIVQEDDNNE